MLKAWRRRKLDNHPFPEYWRKQLNRHVPHYRNLDEKGKEKLERLTRYFLAEKSFEGCGGKRLDETEKLFIASLSCIPLLGDVSDLYPGLRAVLVYPESYHAPFSDSGVDGVVTEGVESRSGESWDQGVIIYSWEEVEFDLANPGDGANIVFHECAHQLDYEWGATMEPFSWRRKSRREGSLAAILKNEYRNLLRKMEKGSVLHVDDYAATNIHEFFAVMTETWLERPDILQKNYPETFRVLSGFYNFNPAG